MSVREDEIQRGVDKALDQYAQVDSNGQPVTDTYGGKKKLNTNMSATLEVNLTPASDGVAIYGSDDGGTTKRIVKTDAGGAIQVDLDSALPAGTNNIGDVDIASFPSVTETPTATTATDSTGSPVAAGKICVTFTTNSAFTGTILGVARSANTTYVFEAKRPGGVLAAIAYTVTAGSMTIDVQV